MSGERFFLINCCFGVVLSGFKPSLCYYTNFFYIVIVALLFATPYILPKVYFLDLIEVYCSKPILEILT